MGFRFGDHVEMLRSLPEKASKVHAPLSLHLSLHLLYLDGPEFWPFTKPVNVNKVFPKFNKCK
jgi:hypothetical protein